MKLEKNNQILVRVGGGYMAIDEFIDQFGPSEADKMNKDDSCIPRKSSYKLIRKNQNHSLNARNSRVANAKSLPRSEK